MSVAFYPWLCPPALAQQAYEDTETDPVGMAGLRFGGASPYGAAQRIQARLGAARRHIRDASICEVGVSGDWVWRET